MKYYYGFFRDSIKGELYKVEIRTKQDEPGEEIQPELLLADSAFECSWEESEDIYKAFKGSTATVRLVNKEFMPDLNSIDIKDVEVKLLNVDRDNKIEWSGYATPNAYSQDYNSYYDVFELECIDKLSSLRDFDAEYDTTSLFAPGYMSFGKFIHNAMEAVGLDKLYISDNIRVPEYLNDTQHNTLYRHLSMLDNTVDDEFEKRKILDLLSDILYFLNLTAVQINNDLYILSYDAIANDYNTYTLYDFYNNSFGKIQIENTVDLSKDISAGNDTNISLSETYAEVNVTTNLNINEFVFPDLKDYLVRKEQPQRNSADLFSTIYSNLLWYQKIFDGEETIYHIDRIDGVVPDPPFDPRPLLNLKAILRSNFFDINENVYKNKNMIKVSGKAYANDGTVYNGYNFGDLVYKAGSSAVPSAYDNILSTPIWFSIWSGNADDLSNEGNEFLLKGDEHYGYKIFHNDSTFTDSWLRLDSEKEAYVQKALDPVENAKFELLTFTTPDLSINSNEFFNFNAGFTYDIDFNHWDFNDGSSNIYCYRPMCFQWAKIKFELTNGETLYYNGESWSSTAGLTKLWIDVKGYSEGFSQSEMEQCDTGFYDQKSLKSNYKNIEGYSIKSPATNGYNISGKLSIIICRPWGLCKFKCISTLIENPEIKIVSKYDRSAFDENSDNIKYSYNSGLRAEKFETDVNFASDPLGKNSKVASNSLYINDNSKVKYLDYLQNISTGDVMIPEDLLVEAYRRQMCKPALCLNTTIHSDDANMLSKFKYSRFADRDFIVNGMSIDYKNMSKTMNLVEKL